jgi:dihydrofolate reductase
MVFDDIIARKDNSVSWLNSSRDIYGKGVSDDSAEEVVKAMDCLVLGARTYEHALQLGWPYGDTPTIVITNRELPSTRKSVKFYSGDLKRLVDEILAPRYGNIWLVGGAMLCQRVFSASAWWTKSDCRLSRSYWVTGYACLTTPVSKGDGI